MEGRNTQVLLPRWLLRLAVGLEDGQTNKVGFRRVGQCSISVVSENEDWLVGDIVVLW